MIRSNSGNEFEIKDLLPRRRDRINLVLMAIKENFHAGLVSLSRGEHESPKTEPLAQFILEHAAPSNAGALEAVESMNIRMSKKEE